MTEQLGLFDAPAPKPAIGVVHWLHVGTKRARTGCGIMASEYLRTERAAIAEESGERFSCTLDRFSNTVTCEACLEMVR